MIENPEVREIHPDSIRKPASDLGDMLKSSEQEISQTQNNLNENMKNEGGFDGRNRGLANTKVSEFESPDSEKQDSLKIKIKPTKRRKR